MARACAILVRLVAVLLVVPSATIAAGGAPAGADDYVWRNVKVGGGGFVPGIVFSRARKGVAYLRSDMGGAYRWDAMARGWIALGDANPDPNYRGVESIAPDPADPDIVYAAVGTYERQPAAILRSTDRGASWTIFPVSFRMGGNENGRGLGERLAIDPNDTSILYFGSRNDGLERSDDRAATWSKVAAFPLAGLGPPPGRRQTHAGIAFVLFDPASGTARSASRTIFAGDADPGEHHLFRSDDSGRSWSAVAGEPRADLLPVQAALDASGILYIAYADGTGPNGVTDGAVYKLDIHSGAWTDIRPDKSTLRPPGGYMGIAIDRQHPGTLLVATMNRNRSGDTIWRSTDAGKHWQDLRPLSKRDVSTSPFLLWGNREANFGWWIAGLAIDPFDSGHAAYSTGATIYATDDLTKADHAQQIMWRPWVEGIEQTAIIALASPPKGAQLLSAFGDIGGFTHFDLDRSPPMFTDPVFSNTNNIDFAGRAPGVIVRSGTRAPHAKGFAPTLAYSTDYGRHWSSLVAPKPGGYADPGTVRYNFADPYIDAAIIVSADGGTFVVTTPDPVLTRDRGKDWLAIKGLPPSGRPVADRVDPSRFYAMDFDNSIIMASDDSGASFSPLPTTGLPAGITAGRPVSREAAWPLMATPGKRGDLWFLAQHRLFHSADGGKSFTAVDGGLAVEALGFGKAPRGQDYPALFAVGETGGTTAIWRSDDQGASWIRVNDARHEYGRAFRCIAGDPRVFGRVYVGTDGRGIVYGDPMK